MTNAPITSAITCCLTKRVDAIIIKNSIINVIRRYLFILFYLM